MFAGRVAALMSVLVAIAVPHTAGARDLRADFRAAILAAHPRVSFRIIAERSDDARPLLIARFKVRMKDSFQLIALAPDPAAGPCAEDTPADKLTPEITGFGPGGGGSMLRFCAGGRAFRLADSNLMSDRDTDHGVSLARLAGSLQKVLKMPAR